ncbi:MAG: VWA domain-containing protein [Fimbriimonadaceae bacterium]|jgi:hypothetical protein|nr:VWA domain-containing protein [Fimbriimonadaceae bacterium]
MNLQAPQNLLWFLPLAGIIVLLYMLRMRRQEKVVPAAFLWPKQVEEVRANSLIQKLKFSWLMVLQLLALAILVLILARPQQEETGLTGELTVFVLDRSATMSATDISPNRFSSAKQFIKSALQATKPGDKTALVVAGSETRVLFPLGRDRAQQERLLDDLTPSDAVGNVEEGLRLAAALVGGEDNGRIVLVSDGASGNIDQVSLGKAEFVYQMVGKSSENLAITALGVGEGAEGKSAFVSVRNEGEEDATATLNLYSDGRLISSEKLTLDPNRPFGKTFSVPSTSRLLRAELETNDFLASDNSRVALVDPALNLRVLLVSPGNIFLERALALDPRVTLDRSEQVPQSELPGSGTSQYSLVVFDGVPEVPVKAPGVLNFASPGETSIVRATGQVERPRFVSQEEIPLFEGVDLGNVTVQMAQRTSLRPGAKSVALGSNGALVAVKEGARRAIYVSFAPFSSDFPLDASFPIFISNSLDFLAGAVESNQIVTTPGRSLALASDRPLDLVDSQGVSRRFEPLAGSVTLQGIDRIGEYLIRGGDQEKRLIVTSAVTEKGIAPNSRLDLATGTARAVESPTRFTDLWRPFIFLVLVVLSFEWWLFARKS